MEGAEIATEIPPQLDNFTGDANKNSRSDAAVQSVIEGIFEDLMLGVRVEEALNHQIKSSKGDVKALYTEGEEGGETWTRTEDPSNRWLRELGKELMGAGGGAELAQALVALGQFWLGGLVIWFWVLMKTPWNTEAAYWLDRRASGKTCSPFYHSLLSNYPENTFAILNNGLPVDNQRLDSRNTTDFPEWRPNQPFFSFLRYYRFAKTFSWELLTLFSLSRSFRRAASDISETEWECLLDVISQNKGSFVLISKTTRPQHRTLLISMFRVLGIVENIIDNPSDAWMATNNWIYAAASTNYGRFEREDLRKEELDGPMSDKYLNHPQRWFVAIDRQSIFPVDPVYTPIVESLIHTQDFGNENDPRCIGGDSDGPGKLKAARKVCCETKCFATCSCTFISVFPEPLVEIIETDGKGLGVRSLQVHTPFIFNALSLLADALI